MKKCNWIFFHCRCERRLFFAEIAEIQSFLKNSYAYLNCLDLTAKERAWYVSL